MASPTADFANYTALNIEAYPDPAPPIIKIIAQRPGQSPEEMERYVTIPIEIAIASTPGLRYIRSKHGLRAYGLASHDRGLVGTDVGELDRPRRRGRPPSS